ncbi:hypothetical protein BJ875DRAFT_491934 [Amylocarpus encephaloides]|uniref:Uncharacterized protein n=1 Tax=Amylocarpus encephaloides TaxID=45428 RepID=A0A9P8CA36_9HELO|nr:hypothetical protein BJ875DRAFT_491934 [Amylocarpus encephaloides]
MADSITDNSGESITVIIESITSLSVQAVSTIGVNSRSSDDDFAISGITLTLTSARTITVHVSELSTFRAGNPASANSVSTISSNGISYGKEPWLANRSILKHVLTICPTASPNATTITVPGIRPTVTSIITSTSSGSSTSAISSASAVTTDVKKSAAIPSLNNPIKGMVDTVKWLISPSDFNNVTSIRSTSAYRFSSPCDSNEITRDDSPLPRRSGMFEKAMGGALNSTHCYFQKWSSDEIAAWAVLLYVAPSAFLACIFYDLYLVNKHNHPHRTGYFASLRMIFALLLGFFGCVAPNVALWTMWTHCVMDPDVTAPK